MDIDLDFPTTFDPLDHFKAIRASMVKNDKLAKHPVGVYFQNIPVDPQTNLAAIPYEEAEALGYFKIDFLHLTLLDNFQSKDEIRELIKHEPDWSLLLQEDVVSKLFQIHRHHKTLIKVKPQSVQELADTIALIRPGKRALLPAYIKNKEAVRPQLYTKSEDGQYSFKKSHAIAYSLTIVLQLHLIKSGLL